MIKFLFDETINQVRPFYTPGVIKELLDLNWSSGEKDLESFSDQLLTSLTEEDRDHYSSEMRNILNKKLRMSREFLAAHILNTKLKGQLTDEIGNDCSVLVNCLDHGVDAVVVDRNDEILRYMELKSTKASLVIARRRNLRGDQFGDVTANYGSTFKFHLNKTDDHAKNYLNLLKNLRKKDVSVFLYTLCFEKGINGIVDAFYLSGRNCAEILDQLKGSSLKQIAPTSCMGKYRDQVSFVYKKDLNKGKI